MTQRKNHLGTLAIAAFLPLAIAGGPRGGELRGAEPRGAELQGAEVSRIAAEPSVAVAEQWWPELTNAVTPIACDSGVFGSPSPPSAASAARLQSAAAAVRGAMENRPR